MDRAHSSPISRKTRVPADEDKHLQILAPPTSRLSGQWHMDPGD